MRAVLLAAGVGRRLGADGDAEIGPKCLLRFNGKTLLERHLEALRRLGVTDVTLALGYDAQAVERELDAMALERRPHIVINDRFKLGSALTLWCAREGFDSSDASLLMDADVLYDATLLRRLAESRHENCLLIDCDFEPGDEPVKVCVRDGLVVEFSKQPSSDIGFDIVGESVGFMRLSPRCAQRLIARCDQFAQTGKHEAPHEEAVRELILEGDERFGTEDITGTPWIEIDFPADLVAARERILPRLADHS